MKWYENSFVMYGMLPGQANLILPGRTACSYLD